MGSGFHLNIPATIKSNINQLIEEYTPENKSKYGWQ